MICEVKSSDMETINILKTCTFDNHELYISLSEYYPAGQSITILMHNFIATEKFKVLDFYLETQLHSKVIQKKMDIQFP